MNTTKDDCIYNDGDLCRKGLPGTPCQSEGCSAFISKADKMQFYHDLQMREMDRHID